MASLALTPEQNRSLALAMSNPNEAAKQLPATQRDDYFACQRSIIEARRWRA